MSLIRTIWQCMLSPRLYKIYEKTYEPKNLERWGDQAITSFAVMWSISLYALPFAVTFMYRRSYPLTDNVYSLAKLVAGAGAILAASLIARGYSRATNPVYLDFVKTLRKARSRYNVETKGELHKYDFEFWAWPVDYRYTESEGNQSKKITLERLASTSSGSERAREQGGGKLLALPGKLFSYVVPCKVFSYIVANTVAVKLMYPGSVSLINYAMRSTLLQGRTDLIKRGGERFKLVTFDGNEIDAMFVDQRNKEINGDVLVITCEGNCGFYEIGIISTPLSKGYSVLGWNHPGFGGSTGTPYPSQEQNGIDCVMRFAMDRLGFPEEKIILHGWSIGGYTTTWAAMNYPSVQSVVLDATFDDVLPLAIARMPAALDGLVRITVRQYLNLNIAAQLNKYDGPVLLIRRTDDEMMCTPTGSIDGSEDPENCGLAGNRGNNLLAKLLGRRYPHVFQSASESALLSRFLRAPNRREKKTILAEIGVDEERCMELVKADIDRNDGRVTYPSTLGENCDSTQRQQLALFLATKYMTDQHSQHCTPLVRELFHPGWDPLVSIALKQS